MNPAPSSSERALGVVALRLSDGSNREIPQGLELLKEAGSKQGKRADNATDMQKLDAIVNRWQDEQENHGLVCPSLHPFPPLDFTARAFLLRTLCRLSQLLSRVLQSLARFDRRLKRHAVRVERRTQGKGRQVSLRFRSPRRASPLNRCESCV